MRRVAVWLKWTVGMVLGLSLLAALALWLFLRGSLAKLDGQQALGGLQAAVSVTRDALGVPTVRGANRLDIAQATGYLHAQERFFQMDLLRRVAAGELAGLVGAAALDTDRAHRLHRFRARAEQALARLSEADRSLLQRYSAGVNQGLHDLRSRPFEYGLLASQPTPWQPADSLLVVWAMYFDLQGNLPKRELARGWLQAHSTPEQLAFLLPEGSALDVPLDAEALPQATVPLPMRGPDWFGQPAAAIRPGNAARSSVGSNNWALDGTRSQHGGAILANDMHLGLRLPHIWYRADLVYPQADGSTARITGVTLPGAPLVVVGSNGRVAWGFTNSYGDYLDLIELEADPANPRRFRSAAGWELAREYRETLSVKGEAAQSFLVRESSLGPIRQIGERWYALRWVAHDAGAVNLELARLEQAGDLAAAQAVANRAGIPAQNMLAADASGQIGWTIAGPLPARDASLASSFPYRAGSLPAWQGLRAPDDYPRWNQPADGQLSTANSRQLAGTDYRKLGDGGADPGARARQIRDALRGLTGADERAVHAIGLDSRALFMQGWRERALRTLDEAAVQGQPLRAEFRRLLRDSWQGEASVDSVGYRLARGYLYALYAQVFGGLDAQLNQLEAGADYDLANPRWPLVLAQLLDARPSGWLRGRDWRALELAAIDSVIAELSQDGRPLAAATWGERNTARIAHPFAKLLPPLARWLSAPADAMPGDEHMPRVSGPSFGQSQRMVVSPGREAQGILSMPGGQSGHPLSPYFLAGHAAWVRGEPTPFLPGSSRHTLTLLPN